MRHVDVSFAFGPLDLLRRSSARGPALLLAVAAVWASSADAYRVGDDLWDADRGPSEFVIDEAGSEDISDGSDVDEIRDAFRTWECVPGHRLRFREGTGTAPRRVDFSDGLNTVFFDEDGSSGVGFGPGTLAVNISPADPDNATVIAASEIVFNGIHHTWSTDLSPDTADVRDTALHEIGHWVGILHSCTDATESNCLSPSESVMAPAGYSGGTLKDDDKDAIRSIYPQDPDDDSTCEGPFRIGETCTCNEECVDGLDCIEGLDGALSCSPGCSSNDTTCPAGYFCVLGPAPQTGAAAPGTCVARGTDDTLAPPGANCSRTADCAQGTCVAVSVVGRSICRVSCDVNDDCPFGTGCVEGVCLGLGSQAGTACPNEEPPEPTCGCTTSTDGAPPLLPLAMLGLAFGWARRRRRPTPRVPPIG